MSTPATRSLPAVLRGLSRDDGPGVRLLVGTFGAAHADGRYANVTLDDVDLVLPRLKGAVMGAAGQPAYVLADQGRLLVIGTVAT